MRSSLIKKPMTKVNTCRIFKPSIKPAAPPTSARNSIESVGLVISCYYSVSALIKSKPDAFEYEAISLTFEFGNSAKRITIDVMSFMGLLSGFCGAVYSHAT
jgi:hypothetical protein